METDNLNDHRAEVEENFTFDEVIDERNHGYNLRDRKVDEVTKFKRVEHQKMRNKRIQHTRLERKKKEAEWKRRYNEAKELVRVTNKLMEESHEKQLEYQSESEKDNENWRCEIINTPPRSRRGDWVPYVDTSDEEFGTTFELKGTSWSVERFAVKLSQSVVCLESFTGNTKLFSCSGIIYEIVETTGYIISSATLVRSPEKDKCAEADELKITVLLPSGDKLDGFVSNVDFYYNICLIQINCPFHLRSTSFSLNTGFADFTKCQSKDVMALGRSSITGTLKVSLGKLIPRRSRFDCEELLVSTCMISKRGIGGPLMDFDGNVIGLNFYDKNGTPFLPSFILLKCLQHFKILGKVMRPQYGLRVKNILDAPLSLLERMVQNGFTWFCGVIVDQVEEGSCAELCNIERGDIITDLDGLPFSNAAEMGAILLGRYAKHILDVQKMSLSEDPNQIPIVFPLKFGVTKAGGKCEQIKTTVIVDNNTPSGINRWPVPKPCIVRSYLRDVLMFEEWFETDF